MHGIKENKNKPSYGVFGMLSVSEKMCSRWSMRFQFRDLSITENERNLYRKLWYLPVCFILNIWFAVVHGFHQYNGVKQLGYYNCREPTAALLIKCVLAFWPFLVNFFMNWKFALCTICDLSSLSFSILEIQCYKINNHPSDATLILPMLAGSPF